MLGGEIPWWAVKLVAALNKQGVLRDPMVILGLEQELKLTHGQIDWIINHCVWLLPTYKRSLKEKKVHTIVVKEVGKPAEKREVEQLDYRGMKDILGGGMLELLRVSVQGGVLDLWLDEEGKLKSLPGNFLFPRELGTMPGDYASGTCFFAQSDSDGESHGLTPEEADGALKWFNAQESL